MKSIAKIKQRIKKNEKGPELGDRRTVSMPQGRELEINRGIRNQKSKLTKELQEKIKKSNELGDEIKEKSEKSKESGEEIILKAEKEALKILKDAGDVKSQAEKLMKDANTLAEQVESEEKRLLGMVDNIKSRQKGLQSQEGRISCKDAEITNKEIKISGNLDIVANILDDIGDLFSLTVEKVKSLSEIESSVKSMVFINLAKADKMYIELKEVRNDIEVGKEALKKREKLLDIERDRLVDKERTLKRSAQEIEKEKLNYGK